MVSCNSNPAMCSSLRYSLAPLELFPEEIRNGTKDPVVVDIYNGSSYVRVLLIEKIGEGGFGKVYRGELEADRSINYAVKCVCVTNQRSVVANEVAMHRYISGNTRAHPKDHSASSSSVVMFKGCTEERIDDNHYHFYIATEFCSDGDLCSLIMKDNYKADDACIKQLFLQICSGVELCHSMHIYHRDLKPDNIFCKNGAEQVVLGDFGFATQQRRQKHFNIGSAPYMSPELRMREEFCAAKADVWALGVILVAMITRTLPWDECNVTDYDYAYYRLCDPNHLLTRFDISKEVNEVLKKVFCDPNKRLTAAQLRKEIEKINEFGPGTHLIYDLDLERLEKNIAKRYGPRKSLLLPLKLDQLHRDANATLWALPSTSKFDISSLDIEIWADRASTLRQHADVLLAELHVVDPSKRNRCQYKAGRVREVLGLIDRRLAEIRTLMAKKATDVPSDLTVAALKIVSNLFSITSNFVNKAGPGIQSVASASFIPPLPAAKASSGLSSEPSTSITIPIVLVDSPAATNSDSSGEDSSGPVTPETTAADVGAAASPTVEASAHAGELTSVLEEEPNIEELDLTDSDGFTAVSLRKPPAVAIVPAPPVSARAPVAAAKLPPIRAPSMSRWPLPPGAGTWLVTRKPSPLPRTKVASKKPAKPKANLPDDNEKLTPPPNKRSPSSSQRLFQAAVRFLANPVRAAA